MIIEFISQFGASLDDVSSYGKEYYLVPNEMKPSLEKLDEDPQGAGLFLGRIEGKKFIPSPALLNEIAQQTDQKIQVNERGAWLFVCGRDIFAENIIQPCEKDPVLVLNRKDEVLGYASKQKGQYRNMYDIGYLLRREQKK